MSTGSETGQTSGVLKDRLAPIVGIGALLIYVAALVFMASNLAAPDLQWTRATFLLSGLEAVAFAAAGFFFGREVNRQRAEKAEEARDAAGARAEQASGEAAEVKARGQALAAAVRAQAGQLTSVPFGSPSGAPAAPPDIRPLVDLANKYFPD